MKTFLFKAEFPPRTICHSLRSLALPTGGEERPLSDSPQAPWSVVDPAKNGLRLSVSFINQDGQMETGVAEMSSRARDDESGSFSQKQGISTLPALGHLSEAVAVSWLQRALLEKGHVVITPADGLARVWFAGVGETERLFVEVVPRDKPQGSALLPQPSKHLYSLGEAEALLKRIFGGEASDDLAKELMVVPEAA